VAGAAASAAVAIDEVSRRRPPARSLETSRRGLPVPAHRTAAPARQPGGGQAVGRASLAVRQRGDLRMSGSATTSSAGALVHSHRGRPGERSEDRSGLSVAVIASATWPAASASAADTSAAAESIGAAATTASR